MVDAAVTKPVPVKEPVATENEGEEPATVEDQSLPRKWYLDAVMLLLWNSDIEI